MVPHPHRDAPVVEHLPDVVGVDPVDDERHRAAPVDQVARPDDADARHLGQPASARSTSSSSCSWIASMPISVR